MALVGARPVSSPWILGRRTRSRVGSRPRRASRSRPFLGAGRRAGGQAVDIRRVMVAIFAASALAIFYLSQSTRVAATGYVIDNLEATLAERRAEQQSLVWQIGQARSPATIEHRARTDLDLVPLAPEAVRFAPAAGTAH